MFDSLLKLGKDVADIASTPVEVTADLARVVTKPMAELADEVKKEVKDLTKD